MDDRVARMVRELVEAARVGDRHVGEPDDPELAGLARAFNHMVDRLQRLEERGTAFRHALDRLGDALTVSHDRAGIISAVLETSALSVGAERGVFFAVVPGGDGLRAIASYRGDADVLALAEGEGLAGEAAVHDHVAVWPGPVAPAAAESVAGAKAAVAVPLRRGARPLGVLALYGRRDGGRFGEEEVQLLNTLVRQAETAIENTFLYEEATRLSITDGLTGLWNRRLFDLRMNEELQRAVRFQEPFGLLVVDLDHFKEVNDRYGHQAGDAVLIELAQRLTDATREVDVVTRFGGEEFALILPKTPVQGTMRLAAKVREVVAAQPFTADGASIHVTVSVGAAAYPDHGLSAVDLLRAADGALYRAKANGRDRVEEAEPGGRPAVRGAGAGAGR